MDVHVTKVQMSASNLHAVLEHFEANYGIGSREFYARYMQGEFLGIHDAIRWAGYWRAYLRVTGDTLPPKTVSQELISAVG